MKHTLHLLTAITVLMTAGCVNTTRKNILLGQYTDKEPLTDAAERILTISSDFKKGTYAMKPIEGRLGSLRKYEENLRPYLTPSFSHLFKDYVEAKIGAFETEGPASRYDTGQTDPLLQRRWEPDVVVLSTEGSDEEEQGIVVANELLLDGKIYTGYQGATQMLFKRSNGSWLLDEVTTRRRYTYDKSTWEPVESTRDHLQSGIKIYKKDIIEAANKS